MSTVVSERWVTVARGLSDLIRSQAEAVEANGTATAVVIEAIRRTGLFDLLVPVEFGGHGSDLVTALSVIEQISRDDGSVGWTYMVNSTQAGTACAFVADRDLHEIFGVGERPILAGMLAPRGTAIPVDGGYRISGHFGFGSGISHATWVGGGFFVRENGKVRSTAAGGPDMRCFYVPRSAVRLEGNWDVMGLSGTGSLDYEILDHFVAEDSGFCLPDPKPRPSIAWARLGLPPLASAGHGAVATGIAMRALEEIARLSSSKRRTAMAGLGDQQLFLHGFAEQEAMFRASRALMFDDIAEAVSAAEDGNHVSALQQQRIRQSVTYATRVAADVVRWCYTWAGSNSLRNPSALGRCLRDISGATQHLFVDPNTYVDAAPELIAHWTS